MSSLVIFVKILLATILGGLIGLERELHGCAAGLRTHILVCLGSALFMMTSIMIAIDYGTLGNVDPSRIASGVVTGIGFLGAGAIIRYGASIRGLTTAASIWAVSAVGLAVGGGMYEAAGIATGVSLAVLILSRFEEIVELKRSGKKLVVVIGKGSSLDKNDIEKILKIYDGKIKYLAYEEDEKVTKLVFDVILSRVYQKEVVREIEALSGIESVDWE